jgi:AcrR family transcriptional regulator
VSTIFNGNGTESRIMFQKISDGVPVKLKKTQILIIESLLGLLEKYTFESLSVARITQEALVARNSFYRNFKSKEDILRIYIKTLIDEFAQTEQAKKAVKSVSLYAIAMIFFSFFKNHRNFILLLNKNHLISILQDEFAQYLEPLIESQQTKTHNNVGWARKDLMYYVSFHASGLCQVLVKWIEGQCMETEEEMAILLNKFVRL